MEIPALSYIDDELVDELWMLLKQDGIPVERLDKAEAHLSAKVKFGLGKVLTWLVSDLKGELGAQVAGERGTKIAYAAPVRLLLLLELLPSIKHFALEQHDLIAVLKAGDFIDVNFDPARDPQGSLNPLSGPERLRASFPSVRRSRREVL
jgi:hypothetical protein